MSKAYTIGIIVFDGVLTAEVMGPAEVFANAAGSPEMQGTHVLLIGVEATPTVCTEEGIRLSVDATIADDLALDVLFVPGGNEVEHLQANAQLNAFIQQQEKSAEWVGSACAGAFILGSAGVLDGKQATTWFGGETLLQEQFPAIQVVYDRPVVVDNRRITANGGLVSYRAALVLLGRLSNPALAQKVYKHLNIGRLGTWAEIDAEIPRNSVEPRLA